MMTFRRNMVQSKLQNIVDKLNRNAPPYCAKTLTIREIPDGEGPDITDDD